MTRRDEAIDAAERVLEREGLPAVTMRRLADELGIRAPSLYKHLAGKGEILTALQDRALARIAAALAAAGPDLGRLVEGRRGAGIGTVLFRCAYSACSGSIGGLLSRAHSIFSCSCSCSCSCSNFDFDFDSGSGSGSSGRRGSRCRASRSATRSPLMAAPKRKPCP